MDSIINLSSLLIVSLLGIERIFKNFNLKAVKSIKFTCSKCVDFDIERRNSNDYPPSVPDLSEIRDTLSQLPHLNSAISSIRNSLEKKVETIKPNIQLDKIIII